MPEAELERKIKVWEDKLLDLSKRNRMLHYRETKRTTIALTEPGFDELFQRVAIDEEKLTFQRPVDKDSDIRIFSILSLMTSLACPISVVRGDIKTPSSFVEQQRTLRNMRSKTRLAMEEQGINILYMAVGFIEWHEKQGGDHAWMKSPLLLVPVSLVIESARAPITLVKGDDDIVVNPTLSYLFETQYGIKLPAFDAEDGEPVSGYINEVEKLVANKGWKVRKETSLGLLSFLKINMYKDLQNNKERMMCNPILQAFSGDRGCLAAGGEDIRAFNHDKVASHNCFQVVDADSSQQDAVLLSQRGVSYVLQGPPGTGKSQTITNIIAQALADGKKVLFVSEKMAALQVVYRKLEEVNLSDFCLPLHSQKANKREVLDALDTTLRLGANKVRVKQDALANLDDLDIAKDKLNDYANALHRIVEPLSISIYEAYGKLAELSDVSNVAFDYFDIEKLSAERFHKQQYLVAEYNAAVGKLGKDYKHNPWLDTTIPYLTQETQMRILADCSEAETLLNPLNDALMRSRESVDLYEKATISTLPKIIELAEAALFSYGYPTAWCLRNDEYIDYEKQAAEAAQQQAQYRDFVQRLHESYADEYFLLDAQEIPDALMHGRELIKEFTSRNVNEINDPANELSAAKAKVHEALLRLNGCMNHAGIIVKAVEKSSSYSFAQADKLFRLAEAILSKPVLTDCWFMDGVQSVADLADKGKRAFDSISSLQGQMETLGATSRFYDMDAGTLLTILHGTGTCLRWMETSIGAQGSINTTNIQQFVNEISGLYQTADSTIRSAKEKAEILRAQFNLPTLISIADVHTHMEICKVALSEVKPLICWTDDAHKDSIDAFIKDCRSTNERIAALRQELLSLFDPEILAFNYRGILRRYKTEYTNVLKYFKKSYREDQKLIMGYCNDAGQKLSDAETIQWLNKIREYKAKQAWLVENDRIIFQYLGDYYQGERTNWEALQHAIDVSRYICQYFPNAQDGRKFLADRDPNQRARLEGYVIDLECISKATKTAADIGIIGQVDSGSKLALEAIGESLKHASEQAGKLSDTVNSVMNGFNDEPMEYAALETALAKLSTIQEKTTWIHENEDAFISHFGSRYKAEQTSWDAVAADIEHLRLILEFYEPDGIPKALQDALLAGNGEKLFDGIGQLETTEQLRAIEQAVSTLLLPSKYDPQAITSCIEPLRAVDSAYTDVLHIVNAIRRLQKHSRSMQEITDDMMLLKRMKELESRYAVDSAEMKSAYGQYYQGLDTDWQGITEKLKTADHFSALCEQYGLPDSFITAACVSPDQHCALQDFIKSASPVLQGEALFNRIDALFTESWIAKWPVSKATERVIACGKSIETLDAVLDYRNCKKACVENDLSSFIAAVEQYDEGEQSILDIPAAFEKGIYIKWLGAQCAASEPIAHFISRTHNDNVKRFCELDKRQMKIAQMRIREALIKELPDETILQHSSDELSILRYELSKQRRIKPIRKLFREIPNLLLRLKPCLMMSPLSVAHFLEAQTYEFDMVIFDEASQIFPQDAIGAILRGKQVIIAGDSKQLPPTNFFAASTDNTDNDYDVDDDDYDDTVYDSILEEASDKLQNRPLKWHYRSRNEELIAFSNRQIYGNDLITFPSLTVKQPDLGVEYVYVKDGVYENKSNIAEARKCVMLVLKHIQKYPDRSLGIIAFSEKQQGTIEDAIAQFRMDMPQYEWFFDENKEEPFFVKNLENVQGDERDSIIFSICYARNRNGIMRMNFGPLGRAGGERRLNVAITRAKYNVKLVGSIQPTDIDLDRAKSEGARLLRSYIEFAIQGTPALPPAKDGHEIAQVHDEFAEQVAAYLTAEGYKIKQNLGCSAYTIDIAVEHPEHAGCYAAAVECDGNVYVVARTARERDRIRRTMLESMGWRLYRVWSTDWMRNTDSAKQQLKAFIDAAIASNQNVSIPTPEPEQASDTENMVEDVPVSATQTNIFDRVGLSLQPYITANWWDTPNLSNMRNAEKLRKTICYIVTVEQPIHKELLYRRIAGLFGREKATRPVRENVNRYLENDLKGILRYEGEFIFVKDTAPPSPREYGGRDITLIAPSEIAAVMSDVIRNSYGITSEELAMETTRLFGFERRGPKITQAMQQVIDMMERQKMIRILDEKIQLMEA